MNKSVFYSFIIMIVLIFLWWFSGGTITGLRQTPAPVDYLTAIFWKNFKTEAATIFEAMSSFFKR